MSVKAHVLLDSLLTSGPTIAIPTDMGEVDLHSFATFERFTYWPRGEAELEWTDEEPGNGRLGSQALRQVILRIDGIVRLAYGPRDPAVPEVEDAHVDYLLAQRNSAGLLELAVHLVGGGTIELTARTLALELVAVSDPSSQERLDTPD